MNGNTLRISRGGFSGAVALAAAVLLAPGSMELASAANKDGMVDYSAPVRVRVKKPASADQIDPNSMQITDEGMAAGYDGKQMEVAPQRAVSVPNRAWRQGDLDEMPPPAWEDCKTTKPRFRPLEGPHGRFSAGVIYREFGDMEFSSRSSATEDFRNEGYEFITPFGTVEIEPDGLFDIDEGDYNWQEGVDGGGPYIAFDLLFPISKNWRIGQQTSFSYTRAAASRHGSNLSGELQEQWQSIQDPQNPLLTINPVMDVDNEVYEQLETDVYTLSLGPIVEFDIGPVFLQAGGGLAINMVQFSADYHERMYIDSELGSAAFEGIVQNSGPAFMRKVQDGKRVEVEKWEDGNHGTKFLFGLYVQGLLGLQISERWSVAGFARYDWNDALEGEVGYSKFSMDLSAFSAGAQVGFGF